MEGIQEVTSHYAKDKTVRAVRYMTLDEAKALYYGMHVLVLTRNNQWVNAKVNGAPRTWKRDPMRCEIPLKYGLYEFFTEAFSKTNPTTSLVVGV